MNTEVNLTYDKTDRGFPFCEFYDLYENLCYVQDSSLAFENAIWLGVREANPLIRIPGEGWQPVDFPEGTLFKTQMHINQNQAKALVEVLQRFIKSGSIEL
jgi:hypothetical protein